MLWNKKNIPGVKCNVLYTILILGICTIFLSGCVQNPPKGSLGHYKESRLLMGTVIEITTVPPMRWNEAKVKDAVDKAFKKIEQLEAMLSVYKNDSEISILNRTGKVHPSPEFMEVIKESIRAGDITEGAFDITVAPIINLWGFGPPSNVGQGFSHANGNPKRVALHNAPPTPGLQRAGAVSKHVIPAKLVPAGIKQGAGIQETVSEYQSVPNEEDIKRALELVNYKNIGIDEKNNLIYFKKKGVQVNLGGIAKGYAVDKAIEVLKKEGIKKAIVNAGGNLYAMGTTWKIGIKHPRQEGVFKTLTLKNNAIATSGDYERFFMANYKGEKKRFSHIFDPRTGYPAQGCLSATVIAPTGVESDWLSTSVFVLGPERGIALLKKLGLKGIIIDSEEKVNEL